MSLYYVLVQIVLFKYYHFFDPALVDKFTVLFGNTLE